MTTLIFREDPSDCDRDNASDIREIVRACANAGYTISSRDARRAWEAYSESYAAGWMRLSGPAEIVQAMLSYCDVR